VAGRPTVKTPATITAACRISRPPPVGVAKSSDDGNRREHVSRIEITTFNAAAIAPKLAMRTGERRREFAERADIHTKR
jgi:hypothetical protein